MWEALGRQWELGGELYASMDEREGVTCSFCGCNARVRQLAQVLLADLARAKGVKATSVKSLMMYREIRDVQLAEINSVAGLHPLLAPLPGLHHSEFGSTDPDVPSEDLSCLSYVDETFDYVLTSDTLEHVPDFDLALKEIRRVLKPGGKHLFNIPVIWERETRQRAKLMPDGVVHLLPPSYHAGPQADRDDYLVFNEFGGDVISRIDRGGFSTRVVKDTDNPLVSTIIAQRTN